MVGWWNEVKGHSEGHLFQILGFKDLQKVYLALGEHITRHSNPLTIAFYKFTVFYEIGLFEVLKRLGAPDLYHAASESNLNLIDMCDLLEISEKTGEIGLL